MKVLIKKTNKAEEVKDSYALNYLIPKGLAVMVTGNLQKKLDEKEAKNQEERNQEKANQEKIANKIDGKTFEIKEKMNDKGELYASIGEKQIKKIIGLKKGVFVKLNKPIKKMGKYSVQIKIGERKVKIELDVRS